MILDARNGMRAPADAVMPLRVLIVAATPWESKPLARRFGLSPSADGLLRRARPQDRELGLLECGVGADRATRALSGLAGLRPAGVLCAGFAGALSAALRPGDIFVDEDAPAAWLAAARKAAAGVAPLREGRLACSERVLEDPAQKRAVFEATGALAADMESRAVRDWARSLGADFLSARVILDAAQERIPAQAPADDRPWTLLRYGAQHLSELPWLLRLAGRQARATARLGAFLERWMNEVRI